MEKRHMAAHKANVVRGKGNEAQTRTGTWKTGESERS